MVMWVDWYLQSYRTFLNYPLLLIIILITALKLKTLSKETKDYFIKLLLTTKFSHINYLSYTEEQQLILALK